MLFNEPLCVSVCNYVCVRANVHICLQVNPRSVYTSLTYDQLGVSQPSRWVEYVLVSHDNSLWANREAVLRGEEWRYAENS